MDESLNLERLGRLCRAAHAELVEWVELGVLEVHGREQGPAGWRFDAEAVGHTAASGPHDALDSQLSGMMGDAPMCDSCGHITVRNGACYKCLNCGNSMGCS